jgi:hypothetical protein
VISYYKDYVETEEIGETAVSQKDRTLDEWLCGDSN